MKTRHWTDGEDRRLAELVSMGRKDLEISSDINRTVSAIVQRRCMLGLRQPRSVKPVKVTRPRMPMGTISAICELIEEGLTPTAVSHRVGVSVGLVEYYARREGAVSPNARAKTDVRPIDADLIRLSTEGLSRHEIARRLGITPSTARGRLMTLARREMIAEGATS